MRPELQEWIGKGAVDRDGEPLGRIEALYADEDQGQPEWVEVVIDGGGARFVPMVGAKPFDQDIQLGWPGHLVRSAPALAAAARLDPADEAVLYRHYGLRDSTDLSGSGLPHAPQDS